MVVSFSAGDALAFVRARCSEGTPEGTSNPYHRSAPAEKRRPGQKTARGLRRSLRCSVGEVHSRGTDPTLSRMF
jgi:hypothetical protein